MSFEWELKLKQEALGGLSAGIIGTVIGYPLDLIKTRMQLSKLESSVKNRPGVVRIGLKILSNEGVFALYKGLGPPLVSLSILNTINFTAYSYFRASFCADRGWDTRNALAGAMVGPLAGSISTVENVIKTQMQIDNLGKKQFKNSFHCLSSLIQRRGVKIVYTGHTVNTIREGIFLGTYFYMYEGLKNASLNLTHTPSQLAIPFSGGCAGAIAWFVSFPLDCMRSVVQGTPLMDKQDYHFRGYLNATKNLLREKGLLGLYSGVSASVARAFLVSGSRFSAYELALWVLRHGHELQH